MEWKENKCLEISTEVGWNHTYGKKKPSRWGSELGRLDIDSCVESCMMHQIFPELGGFDPWGRPLSIRKFLHTQRC